MIGDTNVEDESHSRSIYQTKALAKVATVKITSPESFIQNHSRAPCFFLSSTKSISNKNILDYLVIIQPAIMLAVAVALATGKTSCTMDVDLNDWFLFYVLFDCSDSFDWDILDAEFEKGGPLTLAESCP